MLWLAQVAYLLVMQALGQPFGFAVWPMGEDRNWVHLIRDVPGPGMMHGFWQLEDRNPLSPWWYWFLSWPIVHVDATLYIVQRLVDLLLGVAVTLLLARLVRPRSSLPFVAGMLVLVCTFNDYREQITWVFHLALVFALLALVLYVRYIDSQRKDGLCLGTALLAALLSAGTYTLMVGALLVVPAIALFHERARPFRARWLAAAIDSLLFASVSIAFLAIWYTAMRPGGAGYALDLHLAMTSGRASVRQLVWHHDFSQWIRIALGSPSAVVAGLPLAALYAGMMAVALRKGPAWQARDLGWPVALFAGLSLPIVVLESASRAWFPGTRSRMIYEVTAPLLVLIACGAVFLVLRNRLGPRWADRWLLTSLVAVCCVFTITAIAYNGRLNEQTARQRAFAAGLKAALHPFPDARVVVVRPSEAGRLAWRPDVVSDPYAGTYLDRDDVTLRFLQRGATTNPALAPWWRLRVGSDAEGVGNARGGDWAPAPYGSVLFVDFDGNGVSVPTSVDEAWFAGLQADWARTSPIVQPFTPVPSCPTQLEFAWPPPRGDGWSYPERYAPDRYAIWMDATFAQMSLATGCRGPVDIVVPVVTAMAQDIVDGLRLAVDGRPVALHGAKDAGGGLVLTARTVATPSTLLRLAFSVPRTQVPVSGTRHLAVMLGGVTVRAATDPAQ
jgi:hypothetical protein